jgi:hypothetical protein
MTCYHRMFTKRKYAVPSIVNDPSNPNGSQHTSDECPDINAKRLRCG